MAQNWVYRKSLIELGFRDMTKADYSGFAGAGWDALILENDLFVAIADLAYDADMPGVQFMFCIDICEDPEQLLTFDLNKLNAMGKDSFSNWLKDLIESSEDQVAGAFSKMKSCNLNMDASKAETFSKWLTTSRKDSKLVMDESAVSNLNSLLNRGFH